VTVYGNGSSVGLTMPQMVLISVVFFPSRWGQQGEDLPGECQIDVLSASGRA
jgi:hypothetical protein